MKNCLMIIFLIQHAIANSVLLITYDKAKLRVSEQIADMIPKISSQIYADKIVHLNENKLTIRANLKPLIQWCEMSIKNTTNWQVEFWTRYPNPKKRESIRRTAIYLGLDEGFKDKRSPSDKKNGSMSRKWQFLLGISLIPSISRILGLHHLHNPISVSQAILPSTFLPEIPIGIFPSPANDILNEWAFLLTSFELRELRVSQYPVYFFPELPYWTRQQAALRDFTRTKGYPSFEIGDQISFRYKILRKAGRETGFHTSILCEDVRTNTLVEIIAKSKEYPRDSIDHELEIINNIKGTHDRPVEWIVNTSKYAPHTSIMVDQIDTISYRGWTLFVYPYYKNWADQLHDVSSHAEFIPLSMLQKLTQDMIFALEFLRNHRIVHGDIKPANIAYEKVTGMSLLTGFSTASFMGEPRRYYGGSPAFAPPDAFLAEESSSAVDIWCLGSTLFNLATKQFLLTSQMKDRSRPEYYATARIIDAIQKVPAGRDYMEKNYNGAYRIAMDNLIAFKAPEFHETLKSVAQIYNEDSDFELFEHFCDFISQCLHLDPEKRISVEDAQKHPFVLMNDFEF